MTKQSDDEAFFKERLDEFMKLNTDLLAVEAYMDTFGPASKKYRRLLQVKDMKEMSEGDTLSDPKERRKDGD